VIPTRGEQVTIKGLLPSLFSRWSHSTRTTLRTLPPPTSDRPALHFSTGVHIFKAAIRWGWLAKNPFADLRSGSQSNPARARYVSLETIRDILDACPSVEWRLLVALARLAGLRCPSEIGALTWGDINWEKGRLTVLAKKTEHHGGEHAVRVVPICPELRVILAEAFEQAEVGGTLVVPMAARKSVNLRTHLERIITKAGHECWPRLFQNLRASCETDWVERYPAHAVAKWLGHSPKVAAEHYLMSREHHFEDVVGGGGDLRRRGPETSTPIPCDANCEAIATPLRRELHLRRRPLRKASRRRQQRNPRPPMGFPRVPRKSGQSRNTA